MTQTTASIPRTVLAMLVAFIACAAPTSHAQEAEKPEPQEAPAKPPPASAPSAPAEGRPPRDLPARLTPDSRNVSVDVTITQHIGGKPVGKTVTFVIADRSTAKLRSDIRFPLQIGSGFPMTFEDVGFNVDAGLRLLSDSRIWLDMSLNFTSVLPTEATEGSEKAQKSVARLQSELNVVLEDGEPVTLARSGDPSTGQQYEVEVRATILK